MRSSRGIRILLVRHGQSIGNVDQTVYSRIADHAVPLSALGRRQATEAGDFIARFFGDRPEARPVRLVLSPFERARETAALILGRAGHLVDDFHEEPNYAEQQFGIYDGVTPAERDLAFPESSRMFERNAAHGGRFWSRPPQGESRFDVSVRVRATFEDIRRDAAEEGVGNLVIVAHGVALRCFRQSWLRLPYEAVDETPDQPNGSVRLIEDGEDRGVAFAPTGAADPRAVALQPLALQPVAAKAA